MIISPSKSKPVVRFVRYSLLQFRFLRTSITLLDVQDQESIKTDSQYLVTPFLKQNRYLDHQLRLQHPGLPQLSSSVTPTSATPHSIPLLQIPPPLSISPPSPVTNGASVHSQILSVDPATSQKNVSNPTNAPSGPTSNGTSSWPKSNGAIAPVVARPPLPVSNVRMNGTSVRTKQTNGASLLHTSFPSPLTNGVNNHSNTALNGRFPQPPAKDYPSTKAPLPQPTLDRTIAARQDPQVQQPGRHPYQLSMSSINGMSRGEHATMNMSLGAGNLQLKKVPVQRTMSVRANSVEENHADTMHSEIPPPRQTSDSYSVTHAQHFSLPHIPSTSTRTA